MKATTMTKTDNEFDVLIELVKASKTREAAIKHVIMFARNEKRGKGEKRSLDYYADLILKIVSK